MYRNLLIPRSHIHVNDFYHLMYFAFVRCLHVVHWRKLPLGRTEKKHVILARKKKLLQAATIEKQYCFQYLTTNIKLYS